MCPCNIAACSLTPSTDLAAMALCLSRASTPALSCPAHTTQGVGLCHGICGNGYALLALARATGEPHYLRAARGFGLYAATHYQVRLLAWLGRCCVHCCISASLNCRVVGMNRAAPLTWARRPAAQPAHVHCCAACVSVSPPPTQEAPGWQQELYDTPDRPASLFEVRERERERTAQLGCVLLGFGAG